MFFDGLLIITSLVSAISTWLRHQCFARLRSDIHY